MASSWLEDYKMASGNTIKKSKPLRKRLVAKDTQTTEDTTKKRKTTQEGQSDTKKKKATPKRKKPAPKRKKR